MQVLKTLYKLTILVNSIFHNIVQIYLLNKDLD
jgi:hypothetical protein